MPSKPQVVLLSSERRDRKALNVKVPILDGTKVHQRTGHLLLLVHRLFPPHHHLPPPCSNPSSYTMVSSYSRSSTSVEDHLKQSSHPFLSAPRPSLRTRLLTRRNIFLGLPITAIVLFCVIFFPVTFARHHHKTDVTDAFERVNPAKSAARVGAVWRQAVGFKDLDDFRIKYYSSGRNNSEVLTGGCRRVRWWGV